MSDASTAGTRARVPRGIPRSTVAWLMSDENPAVAVLTRREVLGEGPSPALDALWARRNHYAPVEQILGLMASDGSWATPARDYQKYGGSLWQLHFLGELHADGDDERIQTAAAYAFSRQMPDGSWSATNGRSAGSIPCLTANVGRALARLGFERDERVIAALDHCVTLYRRLGCPATLSATTPMPSKRSMRSRGMASHRARSTPMRSMR